MVSSTSPGARSRRLRALRLRLTFFLCIAASFTASTAVAESPQQQEQCAAAAVRAQNLKDSAKYKAARTELVACGREACSATIRRDCMRWLVEVNEASPSIVVRARDEKNNDISSVRLIVDGETLSETIDGKSIFVDPGPHTIRGELMTGSRVARPEARAAEERVIIQTGEKNRLIELRFSASSTPSATATTVSSTSSGGVGPLPWLLGGIGVAGLGAAGILAGLGLSDRSDVEAKPCAATSTCSQSDIDRVHTKLLAADITAGVSLVFIGAAVYLALTAPPRAARPASSSAWRHSIGWRYLTFSF